MKDLIKTFYLNLRKFLLYGIYILFYIKKRLNKKNEGDFKTILFIRIDRIGDLVLSTPTIKAIKKSYPKSKLIVLASKSNYAILKNNSDVDDILIYNSQTSILEKITIIKKLRAYRFDLGIDPYAGYELKTALITLLSGARERIGFSGYGREILFNRIVSKKNKNQHFVDLTFDILKPLNIISADKFPQIYITTKELKWSKNWVKQHFNGDKPIVGIHPGAHYKTQRWPAASFAELIDRLQRYENYETLIFGGPGDKKLINHINSLTQSSTIALISNSLRELIALLYHCKILICNNSGPLHIAVATNTPTVSFMGPTQKERWMPLGNTHKVLRINELPCIGCCSDLCRIKTHDCMQLILPSMVLEQISLLKKVNPNRSDNLI